MKVSIIIPCHNEEATLPLLLERVLAAPTPDFDKQVIVVDDGSTDGSAKSLGQFLVRYPSIVRAVMLPRNLGKGAAVRAGLGIAIGDVLLVQDADLEYDPADIASLLEKFRDPAVQVVYGSRIQGSRIWDRGNWSYQRYYWGGRFLTWLTNFLYGSHLTDESTGYKALRRTALEGITLTADGFAFCPELTAKLLRKRLFIHEVPIHYTPRSFAEGKKIRWWDGAVAIWTLLKLRWIPAGGGHVASL